MDIQIYSVKKYTVGKQKIFSVSQLYEVHQTYLLNLLKVYDEITFLIASIKNII